jgi:hypothetical protein
MSANFAREGVGRMWILMLVLTHLIYAEDYSYSQKSVHVTDEAQIVASREFTMSLLLRRFGSFIDSECHSRPLARLILATSQRDLGNALNANMPEGLGPRNRTRIEIGRPRVAEVVCLAGAATAIIRSGDQIERRQLAGQPSTRDLEVSGIRLELVGFRLLAEPLVGPGRDDAHPLPERVWVYLRTSRLPSIGIAKVVQDYFANAIGTQVFVIVRTDPFFAAYDGPRFDILDPRFTGEIPGMDSLLSRAHIVCEPGGKCRRIGDTPGAL